MRRLFPLGFCLLLLASPLELLAKDRGEPMSGDDALALGLDVEKTVGPPSLPEKTGALLETETERLARIVRCPVCQGLSVADSPSESARNMKRQLRAMMAAGFDDEQILLYFESSYGEFIRLSPKAEGFNLLVWILPAAGLLLGLLVFISLVRGTMSEERLVTAGGTPTDAVDPADDPWLAKVRAAVDDQDV